MAGAAGEFLSKPFRSKDLAEHWLTIQVAPDDCTGCGVCVDVCPAKSKTEVGTRRSTWSRWPSTATSSAAAGTTSSRSPRSTATLLPHDSVKGSQVLEPLFEFSGACAGCGETPYIKLVTQLFGDRMIVANATGCSSIYGANLPTTPWTANQDGRGPAWNNSLFEDNAEFGLGMRLGLDAQSDAGAPAARAARAHRSATTLVSRHPRQPAGHRAADRRAASSGGPAPASAREPSTASSSTTPACWRRSPTTSSATSVWIIGGDGWAYDIGFGGLDHVLSSGRNVNVLVLDTEVYSNTGGQASKATQRGAVAKFAAAGKTTGKKDLGAIARAYGNVYVAQVAMGANELQTTKALLEADAWPGPSLVIAYSTCIAHGIDMSKSMTHQKDAVKSGYWPLYRFHPSEIDDGQPFKLDSHKPSIPVRDFVGDAKPATRSSSARTPTGPGTCGELAAGRHRRALAVLRAARRRCTGPFLTSRRSTRRAADDPERDRQ